MSEKDISGMAFYIVLIPALLFGSWFIGGIGFLQFTGALIGIVIILAILATLVEILLYRFFGEDN